MASDVPRMRAAAGTVPSGSGYVAYTRQRILADEGTAADVAARQGVSVSTVYRVRRRYLETGSAERAPASGGRPRKLREEAVEAVRVLTVVNPSVRRDEVQDALRALLNVDISPSLVTRTWARLGFTHKHVHKYYRFRDEDRRVRYWCNPPVGVRGVAGINGVNTFFMIDTDEMGAELNECDRHWGHAPKGHAAIVPARVRGRDACVSGADLEHAAVQGHGQAQSAPRN
jgi:transposase